MNISSVASSKMAWDILETCYQRGVQGEDSQVAELEKRFRKSEDEG